MVISISHTQIIELTQTKLINKISLICMLFISKDFWAIIRLGDQNQHFGNTGLVDLITMHKENGMLGQNSRD